MFIPDYSVRITHVSFVLLLGETFFLEPVGQCVCRSVPSSAGPFVHRYQSPPVSPSMCPSVSSSVSPSVSPLDRPHLHLLSACAMRVGRVAGAAAAAAVGESQSVRKRSFPLLPLLPLAAICVRGERENPLTSLSRLSPSSSGFVLISRGSLDLRHRGRRRTRCTSQSRRRRS